MSGVRLQLHKLRQLQRLKLTQVRWDFEGFSQMTVLSSLTKLTLDTCHVSDLGLAVVFKQLTGLRKLCIASQWPLSDCLFLSLGSLSELECLRLECKNHNNELVATSATPPAVSFDKVDMADPNPRQDSCRAVSQEVLQVYLAGMPHLNKIHWVW